jgi:hypothetical protein
MLTEWLPKGPATGPVTCAACGCRLVATDDRYRHHPSMHPGRDARGCRPACVDALHDAAGLATSEVLSAS